MAEEERVALEAHRATRAQECVSGDDGGGGRGLIDEAASGSICKRIDLFFPAKPESAVLMGGNPRRDGDGDALHASNDRLALVAAEQKP